MAKSITNLKLLIIIILGSNIMFSQQNVSLSVNTSTKKTSMNNGIISLIINKNGYVKSLIYGEKDLINSNENGKFYFSYNDLDSYSELNPDTVRIEKQTDDYAEVIYSRTTGDIIIEQAFILQKGVSGFHSYVVLKGTSNDVTLREVRVVYRVSPSIFNYGYVSDEMQGILPSLEDMVIAYNSPIMDATYAMPDGSVYTKYDWANYIEEDITHGLMSDTEGIWSIFPSNEFINGGPLRQELMVHTTDKNALILQMLQGEHFGASSQTYSSGVEKIYGPFFLYVNSGNSHQEMIDDAKAEAANQKSLWPFQWLSNSLYPTERTEVSGNLNIPFGLSKKNVQVVLAEPDKDIYDQGTNYIFWGLTDSQGQFTIPNVRPGTYTLYAYATEGEITEELSVNNVNISGVTKNLGTIDWPVTKLENKLWQIGESDRLTRGFKISDQQRAYGLYDLPPADLNYDIGSSNPENDWYYAQTKLGTWTVTFNTDTEYSGDAKLTVSVAGSGRAPTVEVYINDEKRATWTFGDGNPIARSAVLSGKHELRTLTFPASLLNIGTNTIKFKLINVHTRAGIMYDCIKLETGNLLSLSTNNLEPLPSTKVINYPNPSKDFINFEINTQTSSNAKLSIYTIHGQLIDTIYSNINAGVTKIKYNTESLQNGIYLFQFKTDLEIITGKLSKN